MKHKTKSLFVVLALVFSGTLFAQKEVYKDMDAPQHERIMDLLSRLTIEEKISLLRATSPGIPRLEIVRVHQQIAHGLGIFRETEEIGLLLGGLDLAAAVGALAVLQLALRPERLARRAVHAGVFALVDVAVLVHLLKNALDGLDMVFVRGADEAVIGDVHQLPQIEHAALTLDDLVDELLRCDAGLLGAVLDLLAVLVRAGQEHHVIAAQALVARHGIRGYGAVGVADVELIRGIIDRRGDVKLFFFFFAAIAHGKSPSFLSFRICPLYPISGKIQAKTRRTALFFAQLENEPQQNGARQRSGGIEPYVAQRTVAPRREGLDGLVGHGREHGEQHRLGQRKIPCAVECARQQDAEHGKFQKMRRLAQHAVCDPRQDHLHHGKHAAAFRVAGRGRHSGVQKDPCRPKKRQDQVDPERTFFHA